MKRAGIIGSGFSGLTAASILGSKGWDVHVYEKNNSIGGRARHITEDGFLFDMGPSWYWMPEVFEKFYNLFGHTASDFYDLKLLDPSFTVIFSDSEAIDVPENFEQLCQLFEELEKGAGEKLRVFINDAELKYNVSMNGLIEKPGLSITEYLSMKTIRQALGVNIFSSYSKHIKKYFHDPRLISLLEFPVLFLGAVPEKIPAMYSLMNYAAFKLGTWYPMGGFGKIIDAMKQIALKNNVTFHLNEPVEKLNVSGEEVKSINTKNGIFNFDVIVGTADYHHIEQSLLPEAYRQYSEKYWDSRILSPSCLIYYLGINKKIKKLKHHNLFFDRDYAKHASEIYTTKEWPSDPLFYVCCPSVTDPSVAPQGKENLFILMPLAVGISDDENTRERYFNILLERIEKYTGEEIKGQIIYKKSYCISDFKNDYNAYKGNAYGLANTLLQTAILKPKIKNKKIKNLFYAGQLTVPGPGVPPSIISGRIASNIILNKFNEKHETNI